MPSPESREKAVETAAELFARQGYNGTGLTELIETSGTPKGSFYFNFPGGKEELAEAALDLSGSRLEAAIRIVAENSKSPTEFLNTVIDALIASVKASDYEVGCPIAPVALEAATTSEPLRTAAVEQFDTWQEAIATGLTKTKPGKKEKEKAAVILTLLEGGLFMAKVRKNSEPLEALRPVLAELS